MSQQGLGIVDLGEEVIDMGDLEFLQGKEDAGDLLSSTGTVNNVGTAASIIPANGKTFYPTSASFTHESGITGGDVIQLQNDGVAIDTKQVAIPTSNATHTVPFTNIMRSLVGDGIKIYRIEVTISGGLSNTSGSLEGYITDT